MRERGFELDRRPVADGRVKSLAIVNLLDEMLDRGAHFSKCFIAVHWHCHTDAGAAHADLDFMFAQNRDVIGGRILHSPIGVIDQSWRPRAGAQGHLQSGQRQFGIDVSRDGPTDATTTVGIKHDCQIDELAPQTNVNNIGDPELIDVFESTRSRARFG